MFQHHAKSGMPDVLLDKMGCGKIHMRDAEEKNHGTDRECDEPIAELRILGHRSTACVQYTPVCSFNFSFSFSRSRYGMPLVIHSGSGAPFRKWSTNCCRRTL